MFSFRRSPRGFALLILAAVALPACRITDVTLWEPAPPAPDACAVDRVKDIVYDDGAGKAGDKHQLDLYLPRGMTHFPVVVLVHGGAWISGNNRSCGLYPAVAEFLASQGFGVVLPNYRLSPKVKHPAHIQDLARAVAWAHTHIAEHGGNPDRLFLLGHSAGGHLVSLLATDEKYLEAEGLRVGDIKGVVAVSGVYRIPEGKMDVTLAGDEEQSFRIDQILPIRQPSHHGKLAPTLTPGLPIKLNVFGPMFGNDPQVRADASPINHVRPGLPPFLILSAENDLPSLPRLAREFHQALCEQGCEVRVKRIGDRNHNSIIFRMIDVDDPAARLALEFLHRQCAD